jgi:hypothetical protein
VDGVHVAPAVGLNCTRPAIGAAHAAGLVCG